MSTEATGSGRSAPRSPLRLGATHEYSIRQQTVAPVRIPPRQWAERHAGLPRHWLAALGAVALVFTLGACGGDSESEADPGRPADVLKAAKTSCTEGMSTALDESLAFLGGRYTFTSPTMSEFGCHFNIIADGEWQSNRGEVEFGPSGSVSGSEDLQVGDRTCTWSYGIDSGALLSCGEGDAALVTDMDFYPDENYEGETPHRLPKDMMQTVLVDVHETFWGS